MFLTASPDGAVLLLAYENGNTAAANWFETRNGTLTLTADRMVGGTPGTLHQFDLAVTYDPVNRRYLGTGTWVIGDGCPVQKCPATITLTARP